MFVSFPGCEHPWQGDHIVAVCRAWHRACEEQMLSEQAVSGILAEHLLCAQPCQALCGMLRTGLITALNLCPGGKLIG